MTDSFPIRRTSTRTPVARHWKRLRRGAAAATVGALALTLLSSAATPGRSGAAASGHVTVTWWNMWGGATVAITHQLVQQFEKTHPSITINELNVPSSNGDTKLLSAISAGDPPDVFTEWNPVLGEDAQRGLIEPFTHFLKGKYAHLTKWMYPVALEGGVYKGKVYALPMSMNSFALYYNKSMLRKAHISKPPKTLKQLDADQSKLWKFSGRRVTQIGFYPISTGFTLFTTYFGVQPYNSATGKYDLASNPKAVALMKWMATYDKYPYSEVTAFTNSFTGNENSSVDPFDVGKQAFILSGPWEGYENIKADNPSFMHGFGVESFPTSPGGPSSPSTWVNGNYNIIPKGAKEPAAAFKFIAWLTGYDNVHFTAKMMPVGGWMPTSPQVAAAGPFKSWLHKYPWLKPFIEQFHSKYSAQSALTPSESEYNTAIGNAMQYLATHKMSPMKALKYVDKQANSASGG